MKATKLLILLSITILTSCASSPKEESKVNKEFQPYVENYIMNMKHKYEKESPDYQTGNEIPMEFDSKNYAPNYMAYCSMNEKLKERKIYISPKFWRVAREQRAEFIESVLSVCTKKFPEKREGDLYIRPFSNWRY